MGTLPSTIDGWQLTVDLNKRKYYGALVGISPNTRVHFNADTDDDYYLSSEGWLYAKGLESTAPGEMATGFLIFQFPELPPDALSKAASKFSLTYHDILERPYVLRIESDQINSHVPIFPGVIELGS